MPKQYYKVKTYQARQSVGYLLRRCGRLITGRIEAVFAAEQDITFVQWVILMHVREGIAKNCADLRRSIGHDSGALTRVIDQMEERDWLLRVRSKEDRRVVGLEITKNGRAVVEEYLPELVDVYNSLLADFTLEEANTLIHLLTKLEVSLVAQEALGES